ncbi:MAG: lasso peptide biosynthesis B2 protein [Thermoanaerobaculales bacterium]|jgi:hypothetical protein|nr:lasso peptide biosynthesis B2 protein [Thermoanaerobaculales bacterium]
MPTPREILLFVRALPATMAAQAVQEEPIPKVIDKVRRLAGRGSVRDPEAAMRAAQRAGARWARWFGGLDTCLTRSLVAGAFLAGDHEVVLHIGFRPTQEGAEAVDGHAWLVVDGEALELTGLDREAGEPYSETLELMIG